MVPDEQKYLISDCLKSPVEGEDKRQTDLQLILLFLHLSTACFQGGLLPLSHNSNPLVCPISREIRTVAQQLA